MRIYSVTLKHTFEIGRWVSDATRRPDVVNSCAKYLKNRGDLQSEHECVQIFWIC